MEISAVNKNYNVATKAQYDNYQTADMNNYNYPAYVEEESPKSSGMLGLTALGILGAAGAIYGISKHRNCKALAKDLAEKKTELEEVAKKLTEQEEKTNIAEKALETANKELEKLKNPTKKKFSLSSLKFWKNWGKKKA